MRIVMIHAVAESIPPVKLAFDEIFPEAQVVNLLDEGLLLDFEDRLTPKLRRRMSQVICYSAEHGADAVGLAQENDRCQRGQSMRRAAVRTKRPDRHRLHADKPDGRTEDGERKQSERVERAPGFLLVPDLERKCADEKRPVQPKAKQ